MWVHLKQLDWLIYDLVKQRQFSIDLVNKAILFYLII